MSRGAPSSNVSSPEPNPQDAAAAPPFFNTTWSTHRVSPLYIGPDSLDDRRLDTLARRLRDILVGDVIRGIQIGLEATETAHGQVGPLKSVKVRWFQAEDVLGDEEGGMSEEWPEWENTEKRGLAIEMLHENAGYVGLLLPGIGQSKEAPSWQMQPGQESLSSDAQSDHFLHLPLLLLRMPVPLKNVISGWLQSNFDCHINKLALGTKTIVTVWEDWIRTMGVSSKGPDFVVSLGFNASLPEPTPVEKDDNAMDEDTKEEPVKAGLRSVDITIQSQDLRRFLRAGKGLSNPHPKAGASWEKDVRERRRLAGANSDDGWAWLFADGAAEQPFIDALARYLNHHLALNLFHPSVHIAQVACGGFVLGTSRLRINKQGVGSDDLSKAGWMLVTRLGQRITGDALPTIFT